ncbi:hypothetical protein OC845_000894 [Tilletia horrida]|nr:hypothetical protein OC845_000894 [Tilletia horrida]
MASNPSRSYAYSSSSYSYSPSDHSSTPSPSSSTSKSSPYSRYAPTPSSAPTTSSKRPASAVASTVPNLDKHDPNTDSSPAPVNALLQAFAVTLALQYASAAIAMPFEVAKLLLQVQYLPTPFPPNNKNAAPSQGSHAQQHQQRRHSADEHEAMDPDDADSAYAGEARHWGGEYDELSDEDEAVAYFQDLSTTPLRPPTSRRGVAGAAELNRPTDAAGYIDPSAAASAASRSGAGVASDDDALAASLRPEWILPPVRDGGVWSMIKTISRSKEGVLGLWKGTFASFLLEAGSGFFQPLFAQILAFLTRQPGLILSLPPSYSPSPYISLSIQLFSHLLTGLLFSPLDTVRTRLVAQSGLRAHRTYKSTWHAMSKMLQDEGGWRTAYFHPNILIPTVLDYTLRPLLSLGAPLVIERWLGIDATNSPALYAAAELTLGTASLLVSLPIETVRRRLQLQRRAAWGVLPKPITVPLPQPTREVPALTSPSKAASKASDASGLSASRLPSFVPATAVGTSALGIRTSVEVRPVAYAGVIEAMYRIVTEECGRKPAASSSSSPTASSTSAATSPENAGSTDEKASTAKSQIQNAVDALSDLGGGVKSLYRGFGLAAAANGVVFVLTVVGGENARSVGAGGVGQGSFAGGGWTEI